MKVYALKLNERRPKINKESCGAASACHQISEVTRSIIYLGQCFGDCIISRYYFVYNIRYSKELEKELLYSTKRRTLVV